MVDFYGWSDKNTDPFFKFPRRLAVSVTKSVNGAAFLLQQAVLSALDYSYHLPSFPVSHQPLVLLQAAAANIVQECSEVLRDDP
jgi:hypothetical protein